MVNFQNCIEWEEKNQKSTYPDRGAFGLSSLELRTQVCMLFNPPARRAIGTARAASPGPLLDAVEQAHKEDVAGQLVHTALHERATFWAPKLATRSHNAKQTATAERMLAWQDLGRGVQPLQAHRALKQIQQGRFVHGGACAVPHSLRLTSQMRQTHCACVRAYIREKVCKCRGSPQLSCHSRTTAIVVLLTATARRQEQSSDVTVNVEEQSWTNFALRTNKMQSVHFPVKIYLIHPRRLQSSTVTQLKVLLPHSSRIPDCIVNSCSHISLWLYSGFAVFFPPPEDRLAGYTKYVWIWQIGISFISPALCPVFLLATQTRIKLKLNEWIAD